MYLKSLGSQVILINGKWATDTLKQKLVYKHPPLAATHPVIHSFPSAVTIAAGKPEAAWMRLVPANSPLRYLESPYSSVPINAFIFCHPQNGGLP